MTQHGDRGISIGGNANVSGQIATGDNVTQNQRINAGPAGEVAEALARVERSSTRTPPTSANSTGPAATWPTSARRPSPATPTPSAWKAPWPASAAACPAWRTWPKRSSA